MRYLRDIVGMLNHSEESLDAACFWLTDIAQIKEAEISSSINEHGFAYENWSGAFRGEYRVSSKKWNFFCPIWHGGQAVKALSLAYRAKGQEQWLRAAELGAEFILNQQVQTGPDTGLILAYEDIPDKVNTAAILESLDGLLVLAEVTDDKRYADAAIAAARWCRDHAWLKGQGLLLDVYDPQTRTFIESPFRRKAGSAGRPLADDAVWLKCANLSGETEFKEAFYDVLERLLKDERPEGNWIDYGPADAERGIIHPRHAYWWGLPMLEAWRDSGQDKWLDMARRSGQWYMMAQRSDGGLFRETDLVFKTPCFGHATSGIACAAILWLHLFEETKDVCWLEPIRKGLDYVMSMQFTDPKDPNLKGCILEKLLPPNGSDDSPYYIRDLGTIFFIQALSQLFSSSK